MVKISRHVQFLYRTANLRKFRKHTRGAGTSHAARTGTGSKPFRGFDPARSVRFRMMCRRTDIIQSR